MIGGDNFKEGNWGLAIIDRTVISRRRGRKLLCQKLGDALWKFNIFEPLKETNIGVS